MINSKRIRWTCHVARLEEGRSAFKILTSKRTVEKKTLGRPRRRKMNDIKDVKEFNLNLISREKL